MSQSAAQRPQYASTFRCLGSECEDTCCQGMGVMIDKGTYEKYQKLPASDLSSLIQVHIRPNPESTNDILHAKIHPTAEHECPFLSAERLCGIQRELGHEYLSASCSIYPRVLNKVNGQMETSLYLSCPEAARQILLTPDSTCAPDDPEGHYYRTDQFSNMATYGSAIHKPYAYFAEVQALVAALIQDRARPMWQRLFLIGTLCHTLDRISEPRQDALVPETLKNYHEIIATGAMREVLDNMPQKHGVQLGIVLRLIDQRIRVGDVSQRFLDCWGDFVKGIHYSQDSTPESDAQFYIQAEREYYRPFFAQHPFILENYLLNYTYRTLFPFGREASAHHTPRSIADEYLLMISQYSLIKGLLTGIAGHYQDEFGAEHVVKLVQTFSRAVEHSPTYLNTLIESIRGWNLANIEGFATLLASGEGTPEQDAEQSKQLTASPRIA